MARAEAVAWANSLTDKRRAAAACAFTAAAIDAFLKRLSDRHGFKTKTSRLPDGHATAPLGISPFATAARLGTLAGALDPVSAAYWLSVTYTSLLPEDMRGSLGIYYTPPGLSHRLMEMAAEAGVDWRTCRVLDPACGGGAFLAPIADKIATALRDREPAFIVESISRRVRGFEIDPFAAWMSQVFLEAAMAPLCRAAGRALPQLVTVCDSLAQIPEGDGFDLVIGNPPYSRVTLSPALRERYRRGLYGHANLYGVFTDLALRWTAPGGVVAYVTPTSFLAGEYFKSLRELLAHEAPPVAVDFIATRKGVFENVQQETMLATYRRGAARGEATVHHLAMTAEGLASIVEAGRFTSPKELSSPWLIPRMPEDKRLVEGMAQLTSSLHDWGYKVSTGPLVWNRYKDQLRSRPSSATVPLIWSEAIAAPGEFIFRADKKNHEPYFRLKPGDEWLRIDKPCVILQRTTAKEQSRRLIAAALPPELIEEHGGVVVENHLNMVRPLNGKPKVSPEAVAAFLNSQIADAAFRCISGSVAVSAFELEALPLPSAEDMRQIEALVRLKAAPATIEGALRKCYLRGEA